MSSVLGVLNCKSDERALLAYAALSFSFSFLTNSHLTPQLFSFYVSLRTLTQALGYEGDEVASILDDIMDTKQKKSREAKVNSLRSSQRFAYLI